MKAILKPKAICYYLLQLELTAANFNCGQIHFLGAQKFLRELEDDHQIVRREEWSTPYMESEVADICH